MEWAQDELGLLQSVTAKPEMHHESSVVIQSTIYLGSLVAPTASIMDLVATALTEATGEEYQPTGCILDCDFDKLGKRKPARFHIDRRVGTRSADKVFFSQAPMPTDRHMELLRSIETLGDAR